MSLISITEFFGAPFNGVSERGALPASSSSQAWEPAFNEPFADAISFPALLEGGYYWPCFRDEAIEIREVR